MGFIRKVGLYNELQGKAAKQREQKSKYQPATAKIGMVGG